MKTAVIENSLSTKEFAYLIVNNHLIIVNKYCNIYLWAIQQNKHKLRNGKSI